MKPSIYPVPLAAPGRLFIMPKPSGEWLGEDIAHYRDLGVDVVVSMLEQTEAASLGLSNECVVCADHGVDFLSFPIADRGLPEAEAFKVLVRDVTNRIEDGQSVAVNCRAGIGRSGMLVSVVLAGFLGTAEEAIQTVSEARGVEVPDTAAQRSFVSTVVSSLNR